MTASAYAYITGKIRVLEKSILNSTDIERMVDAPDVKTSFKVLNDTDYGDNLQGLEPHQYRQALRSDYNQLHKLLVRNVPDQKLLQLIYLERDYLNLKAFFKAKLSGQEISLDEGVNQTSNDQVITSQTIYPVEQLKKFVNEDGANDLPVEISEVITRAKTELSSETPPTKIDNFFTKAYFAKITELASKIKSDYIKNFVQLRIDTANLLILTRAARLKLELSDIEELLIPEGKISRKNLLRAFPENLNLLRGEIIISHNPKVAQAFTDYLDNQQLYQLEKTFEDHEVGFLRSAKRITYGPETIVGYYYAKRNAVRNIRLIMTGKLNNIASEEIKKTLREVY